MRTNSGKKNRLVALSAPTTGSYIGRRVEAREIRSRAARTRADKAAAKAERKKAKESGDVVLRGGFR